MCRQHFDWRVPCRVDSFSRCCPRSPEISSDRPGAMCEASRSGLARALDAASRLGTHDDVLQAFLQMQHGTASSSTASSSTTAETIQDFRLFFQQPPISIDPDAFLQAAQAVSPACLCQEIVPPSDGRTSHDVPLHAALHLRFPAALTCALLKLQPAAAAMPLPLHLFNLLQRNWHFNPSWKCKGAGKALPLAAHSSSCTRPHVRPFQSEDSLVPEAHKQCPKVPSLWELGTSSTQGVMPLHYALCANAPSQIIDSLMEAFPAAVTSTLSTTARGSEKSWQGNLLHILLSNPEVFGAGPVKRVLKQSMLLDPSVISQADTLALPRLLCSFYTHQAYRNWSQGTRACCPPLLMRTLKAAQCSGISLGSGLRSRFEQRTSPKA